MGGCNGLSGSVTVREQLLIFGYLPSHQKNRESPGGIPLAIRVTCGYLLKPLEIVTFNENFNYGE